MIAPNVKETTRGCIIEIWILLPKFSEEDIERDTVAIMGRKQPTKVDQASVL